jgi:signal transduction histidine kinase
MKGRASAVRDAALAAGLLAACFVVNDAVGLVRAIAAHPLPGGWGGPGVIWVWWLAAAVAAVGVALRRRWPLPALAAGTLAAGVQLSLAPPTAMVLAVPIVLYTVAAVRGRAVSLSALAVLLLLVVGWSLVGTVTGRQALRFSSRVGTATTTVAVGRSTPWSGWLLLGSGPLAAWALGYGTRNRRAYLDELHARARDLERERDQQAALAVAADRGRISREVHDVVAHGLSLIVIQAQGADAALDRRPDDTRDALRVIIETGRDSLADMRRMLRALGEVDDPWRPQPGLAGLPGLLARVRAAGTPVRLEVDGTPAPLPPAVDLSAYRIVQEALTNVMKHAGAGATADVRVSYRGGEFGIVVGDDGTAAPAGDGGNGLRGMRERVRVLGGRLSAGPGDPGGFVVRATLPVRGPDA